jgi:hypothetical protein
MRALTTRRRASRNHPHIGEEIQLTAGFRTDRTLHASFCVNGPATDASDRASPGASAAGLQPLARPTDDGG